MSKKRNIIVLGLIWFMFIGFFLVILGVTLVAAASGFIKVPFFTSLLGADKPRDLGISYDPASFTNLLEKNGVEISGDASDYCFSCAIAYSVETVKMNAEVTSEELTSLIRSTNDEKGTFKDVQIKLGTGNKLEASGLLNLRDYGYDFEGPVYAAGSIARDGEKRIKINIEKGESGRLPIPLEYAQKAGDELERTINEQLARMPNLKIESLEIRDGKLIFRGDFPKKITAG